MAVAAVGDAADVRTWSGIPSRILEAVGAIGHDAIPAGVERGPRGRVTDSAAAGLRRLGRPVVLDREPWVAREAAARLHERLGLTGADLLLSTTALVHARGRRPPVPTALWLDALVPIAVDYTSGFLDLPRWNVERMIRAEREALESVDLVACASEWALDGLRTHYPDVSTPAILLPFGAINVAPLSTGRQASGADRVLSVGSEWDRKGMDDLIAAVAIARRSRPALTLDIVGSLPPAGLTTPDWVHIHGWLRRDRPEEREQLDALFSRADAFALLSRAECYGIAFVEAGAHGIPVIGTRTGGIPTAVSDGITGLLVPVGDVDAAAAALVAVLEQPRRDTMGAAGRRLAEERSWESGVRQIIGRLTG